LLPLEELLLLEPDELLLVPPEDVTVSEAALLVAVPTRLLAITV
jgi:hypothetical protein